MQFLEFNFQKNFRQSFVALDFIHTKYFGLEVGEGIEERPHHDSANYESSSDQNSKFVLQIVAKL